jgi:hypothetical protein
VRTAEQITADAADERPFSNSTEYESWANKGRGCYDCAHDDWETEKWCPILGAALLGSWPKEWTRRTQTWEIGGKSGSYEVVDECTEFEERRDGPDGGADPDPGPPPVIGGQIDVFEVFEVFADRIADEASALRTQVVVQ